MDLKRAWRNGFLVSLIFAIPLSDLYYYQHNKLIVNKSADSSSKTNPIRHAKICETGTDCAAFENGNSSNGDIASETSSWESDIDGNDLAIPRDSLTRMLFESGSSDFGDVRKVALQFHPQDIFQFFEWTGEFDPDAAESAQQIIDTDIGSLASLSHGFGESKGYAPGFSGPFMPAWAPDAESRDPPACRMPLATTPKRHSLIRYLGP